MAVKAVGILSPGDMGHTVGWMLHQHGLRVLTCLEGRSERTRTLAAEGGFEVLPTHEDLVREADMILCILVPSEAVGVAERVAQAIRTTGADVLYADCNAVSPRTARRIGDLVGRAGARVADGGIIGPPPRKQGTTRIYASGPAAAELAQLNDYGLDIRVLEGGDIGQASGLKMCYGALTKGLTALGTELLVAAKAMGLEQALEAEQEGSLADIRAYLRRQVPAMTPKAYRWVGEMEEISACFADLGLTPNIFLGAADIYRFVAETPLGRETPENRDRDRDLKATIEALTDELTVKS